ncbi:MAG: hypothetical protein ACXAC5_00340 [Promethearchaeota archaeon]|jgi:hypothetical protein
MEMTIRAELIARAQDVLSDTKLASSHVENGKEVLAHRQLQGVRTKLVNLIEWLNQMNDDLTAREIPANVAEAATETQ